MSVAAPVRSVTAKAKAKSSGLSARSGLLQRQCACATSNTPLSDLCGDCQGKRLQRKLAVGASNDPLELEADRVADQLLAAPTYRVAHGTAPRIRRFSGHSNGQMDAAPASVDRVLASPGRPLEQALRRDMEQRFGHDFASVRVHADTAAERSARDVDANAYTVGQDIVFGAGRFAPGTHDGRRLIAHELTHVVQQAGSAAAAPIGRDPIVQREAAQVGPTMEPRDLFRTYFADLMVDRFDRISRQLYLGFMAYPQPANYLQDVFELASDKFGNWEDNIAASFVERLQTSQLDALAKSFAGRYALSLMYVAMITGDVSDFQREQANRVLFAKARAWSADEFAEKAQTRNGGYPTRIFPIRFMRVFGGDYAPPLAELQPNGMVRVSYPQNLMSMDMFKAERKTIANFIGGDGDEISANEIVIIKDYERETETPLPAIALVDYSNQAIHSTWGKIVEVSMIAATLGLATGEAVAAEAGEAAAARITATAIWGSRLAEAAHYLDEAMNLISIASLAIKENSQWLVKKLGWFGKALVSAAEIADTVMAIYGFARLGQQGFKFVKKFHKAAKEARAAAKGLTNSEASVIEEVEEKLGKLSQEIDEAAGRNAQNGSHLKDEPTAKAGEGGAKPAEKTKPEEQGKFGTNFEPVQIAATKKMAQSVRDAAREASSEVQIGNQRHAVAPSSLGKDIGFQICTHCSLLSKKLAALKEILPAESDLAHEVAFLRDRANGLDEAYRSARKTKPFTPAMEKQAAKGLADELKKSVVKDPFIEDLLNMDLEDLQKNKVKLKKQAAEHSILNDTQAARDARALAADIEKRNAASTARMKGKVDPVSNLEAEKGIRESTSSTAGKTSNSTAPRDHPTKQDISMNIDENKAVGEPNTGHMPGGRDVSMAERRERALGMENRDFKDAVTNQKTKAARVEVPIGKSSRPRASVSLEDDYGALIGRQFNEIEEVNAIGERIKKGMKGKTTRAPGALKEELNSKLWDEFKHPKSRDGKVVAEAIERNGMGIVDENGYSVLRYLTHGELQQRGLRFVKGEGFIRIR